jgi:DNA-directed RNA polymerase subunit RPC12/RpoP
MSNEKLQQNEEATLQFDATCPSCSASIEFNPAAGNLKCPYCGFETEIAEPEGEQGASAQELSFKDAELRHNTEWGIATKTIICKDCSAHTIYDALQVAKECPYCGSHQVMEANDEKTLAPNGVCTFKITPKQASENFQKYVNGKWFMPADAKKSAKPDAFEGMYLPYWTFDTKTSSRYAAEYGIDREVKGKGDEVKIVTDWKRTEGLFQQDFDDHLVRATNRYDLNILRKIEPFNVKENKLYKPEYLSGFAAERYSIGLDDGWKIAQNDLAEILEKAIEEKIEREKGADRVRSLNVSTSYDDITYKYLTLPVWISSFRYKDKPYQFMVNGQTGKVGGNTPVSPIRVAVAVFIVLAIIALIIVLTQS